MSRAPTGGSSRDRGDVDALVSDRYLESIMAAHGRGADAGPVPASQQPDPVIALAAQRLARDLPRLHPSFRFEEALAAKLADAAVRMRLPLAAGSEGVIVSLPLPLRTDARPAIGRPLLIGGALTSAALSLAGAVYVAWRIRRVPANPMARAVRAVARARLA